MRFVFQFVSDSSDGLRRRYRRWAVLLVAAALLTGGCSPGSSDGGGAGHGGGGRHGDKVDVDVLPSKPSKPMTVQQLAGELGCEVKLAGKFKDYRQTPCQPEGKKLVLLDFDTDEGLRDWISLSKSYGGFYLVGERWVVSANSLAEISPLHDRFGGKIEEGENHGPPPSSNRPAN
jgi:hypothetical protein